MPVVDALVPGAVQRIYTEIPVKALLLEKEPDLGVLLFSVLKEYGPTTMGPTQSPTVEPTGKPTPSGSERVEQVITTLPDPIQSLLCRFIRECPELTLRELEERVRASALSSELKDIFCTIFEELRQVPTFAVVPEPTGYAVEPISTLLAAEEAAFEAIP